MSKSALARLYFIDRQIATEKYPNTNDLVKEWEGISASTTEGFVGRTMNINKILIEAFSRHIKMYNELEKIVFPEGDFSKSKTSRKAAQDKGKLYFSPDEQEKVRALGRFSKCMKQIIEADL